MHDDTPATATPSPISSPPSTFRVACIGASLAIAVLALGYVFHPNTNIVGQATDPRRIATVLAIGPLVLLAFASLLGWRYRHSDLRVVLPLGAIMLGPAIGLEMHAIVHGVFLPGGCPWTPTGLFDEFDAFLTSIVQGLGIILGSAISFLIARWLVARRPKSLESILHVASVGGGLLLACLILGVLPRVLRSPAPEEYVESLPVLATIRLHDASGTSSNTSAKLEIRDIAVADFFTRSVCTREQPSRCLIELRPSKAELPRNPGYRDYEERLALVQPGAEFIPNCAADLDFTIKRTSIVLREDRARGLVFIDAETMGNRFIRRAMDRPELSIVSVSFIDVVDSTSPPAGWIVTAAFGLVLAGACLRCRKQSSDREKLTWTARSLALVVITGIPLLVAVEMWIWNVRSG